MPATIKLAPTAGAAVAVSDLAIADLDARMSPQRLGGWKAASKDKPVHTVIGGNHR